MVVERGAAWGTPGPLPEDGVVVRSDAEARAVVERCRRAGDPVPPLGLLGGDLCRTLGGRGDEARLLSSEATRLPVDVGAVLVDGRLHWFVAHLIARRGWWSGRIVAAMNAEYLGQWDVAPRSHPNDGRLDTLDADLPFGDRLKARRRLATGSHVPHPGIRERRVDAAQFDFDGPMAIWLDGVRIEGSARRLSVRVERDALTCVV
jgi:diacylglycerol kinase family enzyme